MNFNVPKHCKCATGLLIYVVHLQKQALSFRVNVYRMLADLRHYAKVEIPRQFYDCFRGDEWLVDSFDQNSQMVADTKTSISISARAGPCADLHYVCEAESSCCWWISGGDGLQGEMSL
jgi:hypothetical protein